MSEVPLPAPQTPSDGLSPLVHHPVRRSDTDTGRKRIGIGGKSLCPSLPFFLPSSPTNPFTPAATGDDPNSIAFRPRTLCNLAAYLSRC